MSRKDALQMIAAMVSAPFAIWLLLAIAPVVGMVLMPGYFLWEVLGKGRRERQRDRARAEASRQRVDQLIQVHLVAHGMADTPINRAQVLDQLACPARRSRR